MAIALKAQTINVSLTINDNSMDTRYVATFYVYNAMDNNYCTITSTNPVTGLEIGSHNISLTCGVPYDTNTPIYKIIVKVNRQNQNSPVEQDETPLCNTDDLYGQTHSLGVTFP